MGQFIMGFGTTIKKDDVEVHFDVDSHDPKDVEAGEKAIMSALEAIFGNTTGVPKLHEAENITDTEAKERLSDVKEMWMKSLHQKKLRVKTIQEYDSKFEIFQKHMGNVEVVSVTAKQLSQYSFDLSDGKITGKAMKSSTVNKYISTVTSFFEYAQEIEVWPSDKQTPTFNKRVSDAKEEPQTYQPFENEELSKIFDIESLKKYGGFEPHKTWVPLMALFTGARLEEVCQLSVNDIVLIDETWVIDLNLKDPWKKLKNKASKRKVPIHKTLLALGLLDYVNDVKTHFPEESLLFPYLTTTADGKLSGSVSTWFGRYLGTLGITQKEKAFHSFRSTFNNRLKENNVNDETRSQVLGHTYKSINSERYSEAHKPKMLLDNVINHVNYEGLGFAGYQYKPNQDVALLTKLIKNAESVRKHKQRRSQRLKSINQSFTHM